MRLEDALKIVEKIKDKEYRGPLEIAVNSICVAISELLKDHILLWEMYRELNPIITQRDGDKIKASMDNFFNINNSKISL